MRNLDDEEVLVIKRALAKLEDVENERQLAEAELRNTMHLLRRKCDVPGNAMLDSNTYSIWIQPRQTPNGVLEIPVIKEEEK